MEQNGAEWSRMDETVAFDFSFSFCFLSCARQIPEVFRDGAFIVKATLCWESHQTLQIGFELLRKISKVAHLFCPFTLDVMW